MSHESAWDRTYEARGELRLSSSASSRTYPIAIDVDARFHHEARTLLLHGENHHADSPRSAGIIFHLDGAEASFIQRLSLITPHSEGGTSSFGFPLKTAVKWLSLERGEHSESADDANRYQLSVHRYAEIDPAWKFEITPIKPPEEWFSRGWIRLESSREKLPWDRLSIEFDLENHQGAAKGQVDLVGK